MKVRSMLTFAFCVARTVGIWFAITIAAPMAVLAANSSLPKQVQADLLRNQIVADVKTNNLQGALEAIDSYKKLKVPFPTPLSLIEAKVAYAAGDKIRAKKALEAFLKHVDRNSPQYQEALALYPAYQQAAEPLIAKAAQERELARRRAAAKAQARRKQLAAEHQATLERLAAEPLNCASKIKPKDDQAFIATPELAHARGSSISFKGGTDGVAYSIDNLEALKTSNSILHWSLTHSASAGYSGSIRLELLVRPDPFDGTLKGTKMLTVRPLFSGPGAHSINSVEGGYDWTGTATSYVQKNPPLGKYCVVALLEEYNPGACANNEFFCIVDWVAFKDPIVFQ
jgi:hypothetical protein